MRKFYFLMRSCCPFSVIFFLFSPGLFSQQYDAITLVKGETVLLEEIGETMVPDFILRLKYSPYDKHYAMVGFMRRDVQIRDSAGRLESMYSLPLDIYKHVFPAGNNVVAIHGMDNVSGKSYYKTSDDHYQHEKTIVQEVSIPGTKSSCKTKTQEDIDFRHSIEDVTFLDRTHLRILAWIYGCWMEKDAMDIGAEGRRLVLGIPCTFDYDLDSKKTSNYRELNLLESSRVLSRLFLSPAAKRVITHETPAGNLGQIRKDSKEYMFRITSDDTTKLLISARPFLVLRIENIPAVLWKSDSTFLYAYGNGDAVYMENNQLLCRLARDSTLPETGVRYIKNVFFVGDSVVGIWSITLDRARTFAEQLKKTTPGKRHDYLTVYDIGRDRISGNVPINPGREESIVFVDRSFDKNEIVIITAGTDEKRYSTRYCVKW